MLMPTKTISLLAGCLLLFAFFSPLNAQTESLTDDLPFSQKQQKEYQRWLNLSGLGKTLRVVDIDVEKEYLTLYLGFHSHNLDTMSTVGTNLKRNTKPNKPFRWKHNFFSGWSASWVSVKTSLA
jgi:hypothetical protein